MQSCPKCGSRHIVTGRLVRQRGVPVFRPDNLRFLAPTITGGIKLGKQGLACRDCDLIWNFADKTKLNTFQRNNCVGFDDDLTATNE